MGTKSIDAVSRYGEYASLDGVLEGQVLFPYSAHHRWADVLEVDVLDAVGVASGGRERIVAGEGEMRRI